MNNKNGIKKRVLSIIEQLGPLTSIELAEHANWSTSFGRAAVAYCRSLEPRVLYIKEYIRSEEYGRLYPRAVYALGDLPDAKKPKPLSHSVYNERHRAKKAAQVASVFALAEPVDKRRLTTRKRPDAAERVRNRTREGLGSVETQ